MATMIASTTTTTTPSVASTSVSSVIFTNASTQSEVSYTSLPCTIISNDVTTNTVNAMLNNNNKNNTIATTTTGNDANTTRILVPGQYTREMMPIITHYSFQQDLNNSSSQGHQQNHHQHQNLLSHNQQQQQQMPTSSTSSHLPISSLNNATILVNSSSNADAVSALLTDGHNLLDEAASILAAAGATSGKNLIMSMGTSPVGHALASSSSSPTLLTRVNSHLHHHHHHHHHLEDDILSQIDDCPSITTLVCQPILMHTSQTNSSSMMTSDRTTTTTASNITSIMPASSTSINNSNISLDESNYTIANVPVHNIHAASSSSDNNKKSSNTIKPIGSSIQFQHRNNISASSSTQHSENELQFLNAHQNIGLDSSSLFVNSKNDCNVTDSDVTASQNLVSGSTPRGKNVTILSVISSNNQMDGVASITENCGTSSTLVTATADRHSSTTANKNNNSSKRSRRTETSLNVHINSDSMSSSESLNVDIRDNNSLDANEDGYQDNTSSNSQQSGGGGSVSGALSGNGSNASGYISLIPPPVGTTGGSSGNGVSGGAGTQTQCGGNSGNGNGEQTDFKYLFEELCPVCGDKVSGYHYGLLTCESCKGFFKRTVQNKKVYTCVAERSCHIDKTQRKRCPYCRFQKCLEVGMKLEAVRADRMRGGRNKFGPMYKRDRARKLQMMRQRQLALQAIRGSMSSTDTKIGQLSPTGYGQSYPSMSIKQEIQIPQVSSLTQSPDSSPSPIAIALGQVNPSTTITANSLSGNGGSGGSGSTNTTTVSGAGGGGGGGCGDTSNGPASLQHSTESKLWFDNDHCFRFKRFSSKIFSNGSTQHSNPTSTADSVSTIEPLRVSPMIREFVQSVDDREWQTQLFTLLQKQSYNQVEVDLFELMCKVLDQNLFSQVDWARNTVFFKDLKVDDQMKLLQHSWSDMLVLDHLHQRIHNGLPDETPLHNGQIFNLLGLGLLGVPQLGDYFIELQNKLQELKFDMGDYVCMKFLLLLNPDVRGIMNKKTILEGYENVQAALLDYTLTCYPSVTDKFSRLLNILPEIHAMASRGEEHLYLKHCAGSAPTQTLLMEMLHAKRKM